MYRTKGSQVAVARVVFPASGAWVTATHWLSQPTAMVALLLWGEALPGAPRLPLQCRQTVK